LAFRTLLASSSTRNAHLEAQVDGYRRIPEQKDRAAELAEWQKAVQQRDAQNAELVAKLDAAESQNMALKASLDAMLRLLYEEQASGRGRW
jgi:hypothetical protein